MKKYIAQLMSRPGLVVLMTVVMVGAGVGIAITIAQPKSKNIASTGIEAPTSTAPTATSTPEVMGASTEQPAASTTPSAVAGAAKPTGTPKPTSTPAAHPQTTPHPSSTPTPPPATPAPVIDLDLGTLTFDNYTNKPTVTFNLPVIASANVSVTMTVVRQDTGATLCSKTMTVAADEEQDFECSYVPTEAPHMMHAIVTAGATSVNSTNVGIDGL